MPVVSGSVTFARHRVEPGDKPRDPRRSLAQALKKHAFSPLDRDGPDEKSSGWVEVEDPDASDFKADAILRGDWLVVSWRVDTLRVPASALKAELATWQRTFTQEEGRPPKKAEKSEQKELLTKKLKKRAFVRTQTCDVAWNLETHNLLIWTASNRVLDDVRGALEDTFKLALTPLTPGALADARGLDESLFPTPELFGSMVVAEAKSRGVAG